MIQFDFGENWAEFSARALTPERALAAREAFRALVGEDLAGRSVLDIGFGQGLGLLSAAAMGAAPVVGCDINPKCAAVLERNSSHFPEVVPATLQVVVGSILEPDTVSALRAHAPEAAGGYDLVHSWGVLHHTGDLRAALANAASLVRPGGRLILAIYNRHWSSPAWRGIKWYYCRSPQLLRRALVYGLYPVIWLAKLVVTRQDPRRKERGMDFFYDVVDWVGGYPYEYASRAELVALVEPHGFRCRRFVPATTPTGCNEFVFERTH